MLAILEDNEHKSEGDYSNYLDRLVAKVMVSSYNKKLVININCPD
jgi:hypothetical protein